MKLIHSLQELQEAKQSNPLLLIYVGSENCGVCNVIFPRVQRLAEKYSNLTAVRVQADEFPEVTANLGVFTIPCVLIFIERKETLRQARYINFEELEQLLNRYDQLLNT